MIGVPVLAVVVGLPIALALNRIRVLRSTLRTVFFLPFVTTGIAVFYAWTYVLQPQGSLNAVLGAARARFAAAAAGLPRQPVDRAAHADRRDGVVVHPIAILLYLAALQSLDPAILDAAKVDGAGGTADRHDR